MITIGLEKSRKFGIRIYYLYKNLCEDKREYILAKQILRSGTSIGANLSEAQYSISRKDYYYKLSVSLKECAETEYWLELLKETNIISQADYDSIIADCKEILKILISTTKSLRKNSKSII